MKCLLREAARQCPAAGRAADEQQLVFAHELGHGFVAFEVFASRLYGVVSHDGFADLSPFGWTHLALCAGHLPAAGPIPCIHPRLIHVAGDLLIVDDRHTAVCCGLHTEDHDLLHTLQRFFRQGVGVGVVVQACIIAQHGVTQRFRVALKRVRQGLAFVRIRFIRKERIGVQYGGCRVPADDAHAVARETLMAEQPAQCVVRFGGRIDADGRGAALLREAAAVLKRKADVLGGDELCVAAELRVALHDRQPCTGSITERALPARCRQTACPALAHVGAHPEAVFFRRALNAEAGDALGVSSLRVVRVLVLVIFELEPGDAQKVCVQRALRKITVQHAQTGRGIRLCAPAGKLLQVVFKAWIFHAVLTQQIFELIRQREGCAVFSGAALGGGGARDRAELLFVRDHLRGDKLPLRRENDVVFDRLAQKADRKQRAVSVGGCGFDDVVIDIA